MAAIRLPRVAAQGGSKRESGIGRGRGAPFGPRLRDRVQAWLISRLCLPVVLRRPTTTGAASASTMRECLS